MTRRIAFCNNKGGVGKTRQVVNTAATLAQHYSRNVLVVDFDPQADASRSLGFEVDTDEDTDTIADVIRDVHSSRGKSVRYGLAENVLQKCRWDMPGAERIGFLPARFDLEDAATDTSSADAFYRLKDALQGVDEEFHYCLIDVPPTLGPLAQMVWAASDDVVIVTQPTYPGLGGARRTVERIYGRRKRLDVPDLDVRGVILNQVRNTKSHKARTDEARNLFGADRIWAEIPLRSRYSDYDDLSLPITELPVGEKDRDYLIDFSVGVAGHIVALDQEGSVAQ